MSDSGYGHEDISCIGIHVGILLISAQKVLF